MSATIVITRESRQVHAGRPYKIRIDGAKAGSVRSGEAATIKVDAGTHTVQTSLDDLRSKVVTVTGGEGGSADQALFTAGVNAATVLNTDSTLVSQLQTALGRIEPYARTDAATQTQLLTAADAQGADVIADSFQPAATLHNVENIGLEPVWPFGLIGDNSTLTALAQRTYTNRPNKISADWSLDAVQAARLGLGGEVASDLSAITQKYQAYISGLANLSSGTPGDEPYLENTATVAVAADEALATQYDGTLRFAPAWPSGWDASGTVAVQGRTKVDVQMEGGTLATAAILAGTTQTLTVRNPWPGQ
jgi:hypothetical protein